MMKERRPARLANASKRLAAADDKRPLDAAAALTDRGQRTRDKLLAAARVVFEREGFLHARITDICKEAKTSYGSFYTYFPSKEDIFLKVVDTVEVGLLRADSPPADATPIERIRAANRHFLEAFRRNAEILAVIEQVATFDEEVRATRNRRQDEFAKAIERRIKEYQSDGLVDREIDPLFAANALGGMATFIAQRTTADTPEEMDRVVDQLTRLWTNAIGMATQGDR